MPGPVQILTTTVQCAHLGKATPVTPNPRVSISGQPVVTIASTYVVAACTFPAMTNGTGPPCVTAQFTTAATRVQAGGQPLLLADSQGISTPNGTPLLVVPNQVKVSAQ